MSHQSHLSTVGNSAHIGSRGLLGLVLGVFFVWFLLLCWFSCGFAPLTNMQSLHPSHDDLCTPHTWRPYLGVGRLKHIDTRYLWMQLEIKKETLVMDGIPTLWNVADLGTKRLSKVRREFPMFLIGIVEFHAEDGDAVFSKVGEETFNQEVAKKVVAKQMKRVKREMVNAVIEGTSNLSSKMPASVVKMVTLLLLQPVAFGGEGNGGYEEKNEQFTKVGGWENCLMMIVCSLIVFALAFAVAVLIDCEWAYS